MQELLVALDGKLDEHLHACYGVQGARKLTSSVWVYCQIFRTTDHLCGACVNVLYIPVNYWTILNGWKRISQRRRITLRQAMICKVSSLRLEIVQC